jgi:hypothetical protein
MREESVNDIAFLEFLFGRTFPIITNQLGWRRASMQGCVARHSPNSLGVSHVK